MPYDFPYYNEFLEISIQNNKVMTMINNEANHSENIYEIKSFQSSIRGLKMVKLQ